MGHVDLLEVSKATHSPPVQFDSPALDPAHHGATLKYLASNSQSRSTLRQGMCIKKTHVPRRSRQFLSVLFITIKFPRASETTESRFLNVKS